MAERRRVVLQIGGMHCASCAQSVESMLKSLDGVHSVSVNFAASRASVEYDPTRVSLADMERAINDIGYRVLKDQIVLSVRGMHCASCVQTVEMNAPAAASHAR